MKNGRPFVFVILAGCLAAGCGRTDAAETDALLPAEFAALAEKLCRPADEPWRTIPWKISLIEAQNLAAEQRKPIFIWAMDGHPLGCT
jgi:hypothetical protein